MATKPVKIKKFFWPAWDRSTPRNRGFAPPVDTFYDPNNSGIREVQVEKYRMQDNKFRRYKVEVEFGKRLRVRGLTRKRGPNLALIATDTLGWYLQNQDPVPAPDDWQPYMPVPFDLSTWVHYFPVQLPEEFAIPSHRDGVSYGWAVQEYGTPNWDTGWSSSVWEYQDQDLGVYTPGFGSSWKNVPDTLTAADAIVVVWESMEGNDVSWPNPKAFIREAWKYWPDEGMTPAIDIPWTGPMTETEVPLLLPSRFRMRNPNEQRFNAKPTTVPVDLVDRTGLETSRFRRPSFERAFVVDPAGSRNVIAPTAKAPPVAGERERKMISRTAKAGMKLISALDKISEAADLVDAVYEALPDDVKKRWEKGRGFRQGDTWGQYGISGADWKLQALWHNWHRLNVSQVAQNILLNEIEDRAIGRASAARDRISRPRNLVRNFVK